MVQLHLHQNQHLLLVLYLCYYHSNQIQRTQLRFHLLQQELLKLNILVVRLILLTKSCSSKNIFIEKFVCSMVFVWTICLNFFIWPVWIYIRPFCVHYQGKYLLLDLQLIQLPNHCLGELQLLSPSKATFNSFTSIPSSSAFAFSSSLISREASLKSVPSSARNFLNPALVPARLTSTDTSGCSLHIFFS